MKINQAFPSKYLKAADIDEDIVVTIQECTQETIGDDDKIIIYFKELDKGLALNLTNAKTISQVLGSDDTDDWTGGKIGLTVMTVPFQGKNVEAIRVKARPPSQSGRQQQQQQRAAAATPEPRRPRQIVEDDDIPI